MRHNGYRCKNKEPQEAAGRLTRPFPQNEIPIQNNSVRNDRRLIIDRTKYVKNTLHFQSEYTEWSY